MNKKGFATILAIVIALAVVGGIVYWASVREVEDDTTATYSTKEACELSTGKECAYAYGCDVAPCPKDANGWIPLPTSRTIAVLPDETEGWQTYRNEEYGFEFRHPKDLQPKIDELPLTQEVKTGVLVSFATESSISSFVSVISQKLGVPGYYPGEHIISVDELRKVIDRTCEDNFAGTCPEWLAKFSTNTGIEALPFNNVTNGDGALHQVNIVGNGNLYTIVGTRTSLKNEVLVDQIAKTFRFTNP